MVAIKSHQADNYIKDPKESVMAYLFHGTDEGRISENAALLAASWSKKFGDGGEIIQIDEQRLADNPDILAIELRSVPMFGGRTVIRVSHGPRIKPEMIKEILDLKPQNLLIVEAKNLKAGTAFRKLFEKSSNTAAIACFPDETRDISRLIDEELTKRNITISSSARTLLISLLGADRGVSRQELSKLALYAHDKKHISSSDIDQILGDSSQLAYDHLISLVMSGNGKMALEKLERLLASGQTCAGLTTVLGRHLAKLFKIRSMADKGGSLADAVARLRPPVYFKQRDALIRHATQFDHDMIKKANRLVQDTVLRSRQRADMELIATERMIIILAKMAGANKHDYR